MYSFPQYLQDVYLQVHEWLDEQSDTQNYRTASDNLDSDTLLGVATQFHKYFAAHYFKAIIALKEMLTYDVILAWINENNRICIVDIGCGGGAASIAFIETVRTILEAKQSRRSVNIHVIGVDPLRAALEINRAMYTRVETSGGVPSRIHITHERFCEEILDVAPEINSRLMVLRTKWDQPSLSHVLLLQVNVVRPLAGQVQAIADAYHQIFMSTPIDHLHILTIADKDPKRESLLDNMNIAIATQFHIHTPDLQLNHEMQGTFKNPEGSSWARNKNRVEYTMKFRVAFASIKSIEWHQDENWLRIIMLDNLRLAWARTRNALMRESLIDEAEIRLFDRSVLSALGRLQRRLIVYVEDLISQQDHVNYLVPKNKDAHRPKSLSRLEAEIISVAIIQVIGSQSNAQQSNYYAYRLNLKEHSEFLYEFWGIAFDRYIAEVNETALRNPNATVIRTDIASYYTHIRQNYLIARLQQESESESKRINWLLSKVLHRKLHSDYHESGNGLAQGGIGSGYYANIYLAELDAYFVEQLPDVQIFRYVDDIVLIIDTSDFEQAQTVLVKLDEQLKILNLHRNVDKTTEPILACDFSLEPGLSDELKDLNYHINILLKGLWVAALHYYEELKITDDTFYDFLVTYLGHLRQIGIISFIPNLRRKLLKYLNLTLEERRMGYSLELPGISLFSDIDISLWAQEFINRNQQWVNQLDTLRNELADIIRQILSTANGDYSQISRSDNRRLRFAISRLCQIGFPTNILPLIIELLELEPNQLREPAFVLDAIALQGHDDVILGLFKYYTENRPNETYIKALILRAMRFLDGLPISLLMEVALDTSSSLEECLMSTEPLLAGKVESISDQYWARILNVLGTPIPPRLKKNFILLLRQIRDRDPQSYKPHDDDDYILVDAHNVSDGFLIFSQVEPEELREFFEQDFPDDAYEYGEMLTTISY